MKSGSKAVLRTVVKHGRRVGRPTNAKVRNGHRCRCGNKLVGHPAQLRDILSRKGPSVSTSFSLQGRPPCQGTVWKQLHHNIARDGRRLFAILACEPVAMRFDPPRSGIGHYRSVRYPD
jgi:hypothetical protein